VSDGGPDRNLTFASIQATLMAVSLQLDLQDQLLLVRNIPRHSYINPVERSMARLNYPPQKREGVEGLVARIIYKRSEGSG